jgi:hypothetical protein
MGISPVLEKQTSPGGQDFPPAGVCPSSGKAVIDKTNNKTKIVAIFFIYFLAPFKFIDLNEY